jgi:hypothetical protein
MKIITFYSDSHKSLYDIFVKSFNDNLSSKHTLLTKKINQISPSGEYNSKGFDLAMVEKLIWIIDNIDVNDSSPMVFTDCDVQFFRDLEFDISEHDILFQHDYHNNFNYSWFPGETNKLGQYPNYCAGFFICRQSEKVKKFFQDVKDNLIKNLNGTLHDQTMMNKMINDGYDLNHGILDSNLYWTVGFSTNGEVWNGQDINVPNIIMHHANFTIGVNNKIKLMSLVRSKINNNYEN